MRPGAAARTFSGHAGEESGAPVLIEIPRLTFEHVRLQEEQKLQAASGIHPRWAAAGEPPSVCGVSDVRLASEAMAPARVRSPPSRGQNHSDHL